jgi:hypothetical protein
MTGISPGTTRSESISRSSDCPILLCYALGWFLEDYRGEFVVSHGGGIDGFRAHVAMVPRAELRIVILANLGGTAMPEALRNTLVDQLMGLPSQDWNAHFTELAQKTKAESESRLKERAEKRHRNTHPSRELAAYTGAYEEPAYGTAHLSLENGSRTLQWSCHRRRLEHFHYDIFQIPDEPLENEHVQFTLGPEGEVAVMSFLGVEFKKVRS